MASGAVAEKSCENGVWASAAETFVWKRGGLSIRVREGFTSGK